MTAQDKSPRSGPKKFQDELALADHLAARAITLADAGIPADGAIQLLRRDPLTRGKELFQQHCASCHTYGEEAKNDKASASDLAGFGTAEWIAGLLKEPRSPRYFGRTKLKEMSSWVERTRASHEKKGKAGDLNADFAAIAEWLASHPRAEVPQKDDGSRFFQGYQKFATLCGECHAYKSSAAEESKGPDFTGYGDANWLRLMIMAPQHSQRYGDKNAMPAFRSLEGPDQEIHQLEFKEKYPETKLIDLSDVDRELIIRWLTKDYRVVFGGEPLASESKR